MELKIYKVIPESKEIAWATIGNFDGVHQGHKKLINYTVDKAHSLNKKAIIITFWPHPHFVLENRLAPFLLSTLEEKIKLISQLNPDFIVPLYFTNEFAQQSGMEFLSEIKKKMNISDLVLGEDFSIGKGGEFNLKAIKDEKFLSPLNYHLIQPEKLDTIEISSRYIRQWIIEGEMVAASKALGRFYEISGNVVRGKRIGSRFGFPTANLAPHPLKLLPKYGVYATWVFWKNQKFPAITNVGVRPSFENDGYPSIESLLLDFDDNIYDEHLDIQFVMKIRDEKKFPAVQDLLTQIEIDKLKAREILND